MEILKVADFDYKLPDPLIAQYPLDKRDQSRLMVLDRSKEKIYHKNFNDLSQYINQNDLLIMNNSKVFPAKIFMKKVNSELKLEGLIIKTEQNNILKMLIKKSKRLPMGTKLVFGDSDIHGEVIDKDKEGACFIKINKNYNVKNLIDKYGQIPLPHYIKRDKGDLNILDAKHYQTVYAKEKGSIAAPTAGLHFTLEMINELKAGGADTLEITLHVGYATFKPIRVSKIFDHTMGEEHYKITKSAAKKIMNAKKKGIKITAVGTTVARALESYAQAVDLNDYNTSNEYNGNTNIFIYPGFPFKLIDGLLTNFHLPKSTLLMLVCAFGKKDFILSAYKEAVKNKYRFYSYGDAMLII